MTWQVKKDGVVTAHGDHASTFPDKEMRTSMRKSGHKIYVDGKVSKE